MPLTTINSLKDQSGIDRSDVSRDAQFRSLIDGVTSLVKQQLNRDIEAGDRVEYYSGDNKPFLLLRQYPVIEVTRVCVDSGGYFGDGTFPAASDLEAGVGYALMDSLNGKGGNGILRRIGGTWAAPSYRELGTVENLASVPIGNILVEYRAGYEVIPPAIQMAVNDLIIRKALMSPVGGAAQSMQYEDASVTMFSPTETTKIMGSLESTLGHFKSIPI